MGADAITEGKSYFVGGASTAVVADFNKDGHLDFAVSGTAVAELLGKGDGTFQTPVDLTTLPSSGARPDMVVADFNCDGNIDIAVASTQGISILLGNGDGSFRPAINSTVASAPWSIAVADFNGDGKPDLAVASNKLGSVSILLGLLRPISVLLPAIDCGRRL